jgi:hypothetical protein
LLDISVYCGVMLRRWLAGPAGLMNMRAGLVYFE